MTEDLTPPPLTPDERAFLLGAMRTAREILSDHTSKLAIAYVNALLCVERWEATVVKLEADLAARRALPSGGDTETNWLHIEPHQLAAIILVEFERRDEQGNRTGAYPIDPVRLTALLKRTVGPSILSAPTSEPTNEH